MNTQAILQQKKEIDYVLRRAQESATPLLSETALVEMLAIKKVVEKEQDSILKEEYHKIDVNWKELKKEIRKTKEFQGFKTRNTGDILEVEQTKESTTCLITQREITDKVVAPCGHVFNREGVRFLYENTRGTPKKFICPHIGCNQKWKTQSFF
ncbi:hypothetical protein NECID01_0507 [Nematocida sp. AWRm77]|nr:hypothetical protein NECID01_0507 [Nematocida sp. AWRm77]